MESAWVEAGPTKLPPSSGVPPRDPSTVEVGYEQPGDLA